MRIKVKYHRFLYVCIHIEANNILELSMILLFNLLHKNINKILGSKKLFLLKILNRHIKVQIYIISIKFKVKILQSIKFWF